VGILHAPVQRMELLADVANGVVYVDGVRQRAEEQRVAA
jgi:hypothetical protein